VVLTDESRGVTANLRPLTLEVDDTTRDVIVQLQRKVTNLHNDNDDNDNNNNNNKIVKPC